MHDAPPTALAQPAEPLNHGLKQRRLTMLGLGGSGVPRRAVLASVAFGFVSVLLNLKWPDSLFLCMLNSVGAVPLFAGADRRVPTAAAPAHRGGGAGQPVLRMWAFLWLTWAALAAWRPCWC